MRIIQAIKTKVNDIRFRWQLMIIYASDIKYRKRFLRGLCKDSKDKSDAEIMLIMHALEKGMSFAVKKKGFGKEKSVALVEVLNRHIMLYGIDNQVVVAINILQSYLSDPDSTDDKEVRNAIEGFVSSHSDLLKESIGGAKNVSHPEGNPQYDTILKFYKSRNSVRDFSSVPLTKEELDKAIAIAQQSPSACNRQASRVYVVQDKNLIRNVMDNQLGDQGWCNNADTLFIVTSIASYFGSLYERDEPFIDGGMFAMNLIMGLHAQGIASCCKMYIRHPKIDNTIRELITIPKDEIPIILILAGHYPNHSVTSPISRRNEIYYEIK